MKEIKFRAWDYGLKQMTYSGLHSITFDGKLFYGNADFSDYKVDIMQYTGLKDINEREIIVRVKINPQYYGNLTHYNWHYINSELVYEVIWDEGMWKLKALSRKANFPFLFNTWVLELEIIGNVYENPELIDKFMSKIQFALVCENKVFKSNDLISVLCKNKKGNYYGYSGKLLDVTDKFIQIEIDNIFIQNKQKVYISIQEIESIKPYTL